MRGFFGRFSVRAGALSAVCITALASCGSGDVVAVLSGSGDATESFRLDQAANLHYTFTASNDGATPCFAEQGIRMHPSGRGGSGPEVAPSSSATTEGGMRLSAGDWLMDFQMKSLDQRTTNLISCHWRMVLTTSGEHYPDIPKTGCMRPGTATFPAGPICGPGDASSWMQIVESH
jgi:hypothetical protein